MLMALHERACIYALDAPCENTEVIGAAQQKLL